MRPFQFFPDQVQDIGWPFNDVAPHAMDSKSVKGTPKLNSNDVDVQSRACIVRRAELLHLMSVCKL